MVAEAADGEGKVPMNVFLSVRKEVYMKRTVRILSGFLLLSLLQACAFDVVQVKQVPAKLDLSASANRSFELDKEVTVTLDTGYSRELKRGARWVCVGAIAEGDVYKTNDQVLTVEGSNIHEAYIVLKSQNLVGFYLPVERTFSPLSNPIEIFTKEVGYTP
ncbi:MAG: hypothetical protein HGA78_03930 [Nitrospirales bacterium]|nr:hypothetical protein [Nitrospirales bacterium]